MRAVVVSRPGLLQLAEVGRPALKDEGILVRVRASSVNTADLFTIGRASVLKKGHARGKVVVSA